MSVGTICGHFPITGRAVSRCLRILAGGGLVRETRVGRETHYRPQPERVLELKRWLAYYERFRDSKLAALKTLVETPDPADEPEAWPD